MVNNQWQLPNKLFINYFPSYIIDNRSFQEKVSKYRAIASRILVHASAKDSPFTLASFF